MNVATRAAEKKMSGTENDPEMGMISKSSPRLNRCRWCEKLIHLDEDRQWVLDDNNTYFCLKAKGYQNRHRPESAEIPQCADRW